MREREEDGGGRDGRGDGDEVFGGGVGGRFPLTREGLETVMIMIGGEGRMSIHFGYFMFSFSVIALTAAAAAAAMFATGPLPLTHLRTNKPS